MKSHRPLVSVIIPVYNHEHFVEKALNSVLLQTYSNIEIIIIDDGSKDRSCAVIDRILAKEKNSSKTIENISFLKQPNQGAHATINRGLSIAKGEWLTILNSDDYYEISRIEKLIDQTAKANAQLAFSYVAAVDQLGNILSQDHWWWRWYEGAKYQLFQKDVPTVGFQLLQDNLAVSTGNLFFKRSLYNEVGPFKNLKLAHDLDFLLRALTLTEPLMVREELYYYRLHGGNTQYTVRHLMEQEKREIYRDYLVKTASQRSVKNRMAPCSWYWPAEFAKWRAHLKMDLGLDAYITRPTSTIKEHHFAGNQLSRKHKTKKDKQVCLISHDLSLSGAPKLVADLALCLKNHGYEPNVVALSDGPMRKILEEHGIHVAAPKGSILRRMLALPFILGFRSKKITIVNTLISLPALPLLIFLRPFQTIIWYIHDSYTPAGILHNKFGGKGKLLTPFLQWLRKRKSLHLWFGSASTQTEWKHTCLSFLVLCFLES